MNNLTEILIITQEECAEVVQAISKYFRFGADNFYRSELETNHHRVCQELGDLLAMVDILLDAGFVTTEQLEIAKAAKVRKLKLYSSIFTKP